MRLSGGVFLDAEFTSPWCVSSHVGPEDYGAFLRSPAHVIAYHYVTEGRALLRVSDGPPVSVGAGEIILLPRNEPHQLGSELNLRAVSVDHLVQPPSEGRPPRIVYGGGGERTRMLCGFLGSDSPNPPIASVLPAVAQARGDGSSRRRLDRELVPVRRPGVGIGRRLAHRPRPARRAAVHRSRTPARRIAAGARSPGGSKDCAIPSSAGRWRCSMSRERIGGPRTSSPVRWARRARHSPNGSGR